MLPDYVLAKGVLKLVPGAGSHAFRAWWGEGGQRQEDHMLEARLICRVSSKLARAASADCLKARLLAQWMEGLFF